VLGPASSPASAALPESTAPDEEPPLEEPDDDPPLDEPDDDPPLDEPDDDPPLEPDDDPLLEEPDDEPLDDPEDPELLPLLEPALRPESPSPVVASMPGSELVEPLVRPPVSTRREHAVAETRPQKAVAIRGVRPPRRSNGIPDT
jgi:hypothetical protein